MKWLYPAGKIRRYRVFISRCFHFRQTYKGGQQSGPPAQGGQGGQGGGPGGNSEDIFWRESKYVMIEQLTVLFVFNSS